MKTLTLILIFAVSLTMIGVTESGSTENRVLIDVKGLKSRIQAPGPKRFDGTWWTTADPQEQQGFIVGFIDCYMDTVKRRTRSEAFTEEYQKTLSEFYLAHPDQYSTTVREIMVRLVQTLKSSRKPLPGGEVWNEPHGYLDGAYWNQSSDKERLGFLEGYIQCYEKYMRQPRVRFSQNVEEYSDLLTKYFEDPKVDHENEKIAYVLHRFAARIVVELKGTLSVKTYYGPPDYGEHPDTDAKEELPILILKTPVNVRGNSDSNNEFDRKSVEGLREMQLVLLMPHKEFIGKTVLVKGTLFHAFTGHHHTDVLMDVRSIKGLRRSH